MAFQKKWTGKTETTKKISRNRNKKKTSFGGLSWAVVVDSPLVREMDKWGKSLISISIRWSETNVQLKILFWESEPRTDFCCLWELTDSLHWFYFVFVSSSCTFAHYSGMVHEIWKRHSVSLDYGLQNLANAINWTFEL